MGLCTARRLKQYQIPFVGFEIHQDVGGLWDIASPTSTMYNSAHLISSKTMTEFTEFPTTPMLSDFSPAFSKEYRWRLSYGTHS